MKNIKTLSMGMMASLFSPSSNNLKAAAYTTDTNIKNNILTTNIGGKTNSTKQLDNKSLNLMSLGNQTQSKPKAQSESIKHC